jgi:hypothetical protein
MAGVLLSEGHFNVLRPNGILTVVIKIEVPLITVVV